MSEQERQLRTLRRDLHRHPELSWCEFYTTDRLVAEIEALGVDELYVGPEILASDRFRPPEPERLEEERKRAREAGVDTDMLDQLAGGYTGAVAVLERGEGPTVGLRVDIDGLPQWESDDPDHTPTAEGFRSNHDERMHACGHDAHAAIGVGVLQRIKASDFHGTLKVLFQPAEEIGAGAAAVVDGGLFDDVDELFAVHVGLDQETGTILPGIDSFLAINGFRAEFTGAPAHAGSDPSEGQNALRAMATAIEQLHAIPRHSDGATRINTGQAGGGSAMNIIPESAFIEGEVRGETTELREYMERRAEHILSSAATVHECDVDVDFLDGAPSATCDEALVDTVAAAATQQGATVVESAENALGGSEDATRLMRHVQRRGGRATYIGVGASNPSGHHTARFDVDENAIFLAVDVLTDAIHSVASAEE